MIVRKMGGSLRNLLRRPAPRWCVCAGVQSAETGLKLVGHILLALSIIFPMALSSTPHSWKSWKHCWRRTYRTRRLSGLGAYCRPFSTTPPLTLLFYLSPILLCARLQLEELEALLKEDVQDEASKWTGRILLHREIPKILEEGEAASAGGPTTDAGVAACRLDDVTSLVDRNPGVKQVWSKCVQVES